MHCCDTNNILMFTVINIDKSPSRERYHDITANINGSIMYTTIKFPHDMSFANHNITQYDLLNFPSTQHNVNIVGTT